MPTQHRTDARVQHAWLYGLDHVVVRARLEPDHDIDVITAGSEQDDRNLVGAADPAADLEAVDTGEHHVEHYQLRSLALPQLQRLLAGGRGRDLVTLAGQRELDGHPDRRIVFDEEKAGHLPILT